MDNRDNFLEEHQLMMRVAERMNQLFHMWPGDDSTVSDNGLSMDEESDEEFYNNNANDDDDQGSKSRKLLNDSSVFLLDVVEDEDVDNNNKNAMEGTTASTTKKGPIQLPVCEGDPMEEYSKKINNRMLKEPARFIPEEFFQMLNQLHEDAEDIFIQPFPPRQHDDINNDDFVEFLMHPMMLMNHHLPDQPQHHQQPIQRVGWGHRHAAAEDDDEIDDELPIRFVPPFVHPGQSDIDSEEEEDDDDNDDDDDIDDDSYPSMPGLISGPGSVTEDDDDDTNEEELGEEPPEPMLFVD